MDAVWPHLVPKIAKVPQKTEISLCDQAWVDALNDRLNPFPITEDGK